MTSNKLFAYSSRAILACAFGLFLAGCGGGGSSQDKPAPTTSKDLAQICAKESPYASKSSKPSQQGELADEKKWIKAYMSERYLWYKDIPQVNEDDSRYNVLKNGVLDVWSSLLNYFSDSKTPLKTAIGTLVDKFSFIIDSTEWNSFVDSSLRGYGFMLKTSTQGGQKVLTVAYVYPNTPAKNAGVARGDQIIRIDGASVNDTSTEASNIFNEGLRPTKVAPHQFQILRAGQTLNITMQAEVISLQQVEYKVLNAGSQKIGYLLFNSHVPGAEAYLIQAMTYFKQQAITDLVVDLRYNGGGYLAIANALAYSVAGREKAQGKVFEWTQFSDKRSSENYAMNFSNLGLNNQAYPSLGLTKIYVLATGGTCSASESFINGLRGIDVQVELIGGTTCGKPYGFYPQDNCGITYAAMEMEGVNAKLEGRFSDGMAPQCTVLDDLSRPLGDASEGMLSVAIKRMQGQSCSQAAGLAISSQDRSGMGLRDESVLLRPDWQSNKFLKAKP
jgi:C-terminal processing protease CtpA/Prc